MQPSWKMTTAIFLATAVLVFGAIGCQQEGPAEKAGKKIDEMVEDTGQALEEAGDKVRDATE